jgi:hypothetical protein
MKTFVAIVFAILATAAASEIRPKTAIEGKCPDVPFVENFDATKFLGKWYSVKRTGKEIPCVSYDLEEVKPYTYKAVMSPTNFNIEFEKKNVEDYAEGYLITFKENPEMDGGDLKVFSTDYGKTYKFSSNTRG